MDCTVLLLLLLLPVAITSLMSQTATVYNHHNAASYMLTHSPVYCLNAIVRGDRRIFTSNRSFLLRKRIIDVSVNHLLLQMESNSFRLSCIRFCKVDKTKNYNIINITTMYYYNISRF